VDVARVENLLFTYARNAVIDHVRKKQSSVIVLGPVEEEQALTQPYPTNSKKSRKFY
jgi:hypothetical protein